jgi:sigma-B regulation protein RsbU (phosphoserine phosphatase)
MKTIKHDNVIFSSQTGPERSYGNSISKVARHFHAVRAASRILDVADALQELPDVELLAIVDGEFRPLGCLTRDQLFAVLGKPYGRDILSRSLIAELASFAPAYSRLENLFAIAERIEGSSHDHFLLTDADGRLAGVFTRRDLTAWLSHMTQEDIAMAARLQERMIGASARLERSGWQFSAWCHPAKGVGGDFYLSRELPDGRWFFCLCDVSGKGVAASVLSSMVWGMLTMYDFRHGLKQLILRLNAAVITTFQLERYLTGVFLLWDPAGQRLQWADMGHSHLAIHRDGNCRFLQGKRANLPIGLEPSLDPAVWSILLRGGDRLMAFTDGITEQENSARQEFGETRLFRLLTEARLPGELAGRLPGMMEEWRGPIPQQDDMSFIILELP